MIVGREIIGRWKKMNDNSLEMRERSSSNKLKNQDEWMRPLEVHIVRFIIVPFLLLRKFQPLSQLIWVR
jgi:hypothetical protein